MNKVKYNLLFMNIQMSECTHNYMRNKDVINNFLSLLRRFSIIKNLINLISIFILYLIPINAKC